MGVLFLAKGAQLKGGGEARSHLHRAKLPPSNRSLGIWRTQGLEDVLGPPSILLSEETFAPGVKVS